MKKSRKCLELNDNLFVAAKVVFVGEFIYLKAHIRKESLKINKLIIELRTQKRTNKPSKIKQLEKKKKKNKEKQN